MTGLNQKILGFKTHFDGKKSPLSCILGVSSSFPVGRISNGKNRISSTVKNQNI